MQYLLGCQQLLNQRTELIQNALNVFEDEEEELDLQISKLRFISIFYVFLKFIIKFNYKID